MVVLLILAADLAWLRWFLIQGRSSLFGFYPMALDLGIIPMLSALAMGGYRLAIRRERSRPFLVGFTVFGSLALIAYSACCLMIPEAIDRILRGIEPVLNGWPSARLVRRILEPFGDVLFRGHDLGAFDLYQIAWVTVLLSFPQVAVALVGGLSTSRIHRWIARNNNNNL
jgi:hypothetical protein